MNPSRESATIRPAILTLALAALLAGCGSGPGDGAAVAAGPPAKAESGGVTRTTTTAASPPKTASVARRGKTIKAVSSQFGRILADGRGQAV